MSSGAVIRAARTQKVSPKGEGEEGQAAVASAPTPPARVAELVGSAGNSRLASKSFLNRQKAALEKHVDSAGLNSPGIGAKSLTRQTSNVSDVRDLGKSVPVAAAAAAAVAQNVHRTRRATAEGASMNHSTSPTECVLSSASWRHNPYGVPSPSPITDSASTTRHESPRLSIRSRAESTIVNEIADYSTANDDVMEFPSIKVCTRSGISLTGNGAIGRRRSSCVNNSDVSGRQFSFGEGGGRCEPEENMYRSRSSATPGCDDPLIELQQQQSCPNYHSCMPSCSQTHLHSRQHGLRRSRANSVQSHRRISGIRHTSEAHVLPSLSTSFSSLQLNHYYHDLHQSSHAFDAHPRTFSLQSAVSSPMMNGSFSGVHDLLGLSRSPIGHNVISPEESAASRPLYSFEAESLASHRSTTEHFSSPMPLSGDFFNCPSNSPHHGVGGSSAASFGLWGVVQVRPSSSPEKGSMEGYDANTDSRDLRFDDDEREVEKYNTTLRPNEVNASMDQVGFNDLSMEEMREGQQVASKASPAVSPRSASEGFFDPEGTCDYPTTMASRKTSQGNPTHPQELNQVTNAQQPIDWNLLEQMMMMDPFKEVMCPPSCTFSVYDAEIQNHYNIESTEIVATHGSVEYLKMNEARGAQSRFRFQLCKRYLNKRCTRGANCQYIHTHLVPPPTSVHVNENVISAAVVEGLEMPPEVLRGGNNKHGYPTMPSGVIFRVFPPNQGKSVPQLIPSEMILRTAGASNVYSVFAYPGTGKARDMLTTETADTSGSESGNLTNVKARHCAHFQFNKMCNLGESCNFIHSLVPYVQRLSMSSQGPLYNSILTQRPLLMPSTSMAHFSRFPNGNNNNGVVPSYPMEFMQPSMVHVSPQKQQQQQKQQKQQQKQQKQLHQQPQHAMPPTTVSHLIPSPQPSEHLMYQSNMSMMSLPMYMSSPVSSTWDGVRYGAKYQ
ncbi:hypothetical protein C4B63_34g364 [Trypanosoma cruzi]|uniref:C3H1-type domain-containing protein n=1 Tax=Trypanosoma cruzi TaxID=5693 RepID=A0A2V2V9D8_TRYCR|nr:hypothetical protein C4B63_34g364 [Trypanosoma cruzi]